MSKKPKITSESIETGNGMTPMAASARAASKKSQMIDMLSGVGGSTISEISSALGWQPHTTRAAITGLRKSGYKVKTAKQVGGRSSLMYRIVPSAGADAEAIISSEANQ